MIVSIVDTETTDLTPATGKCIEIAIANFDLERKDMIDSMSFLVHGATSEEIEKTSKIHGIPSGLVIEHGASPTFRHALLKQQISENNVVLAHNSDFDSQWFTDIPDIHWVCTQNDISWPKFSSSKSLASIAIAHGVGVVSAHRALEDVMTIVRLLKRVGETNDLVALVKHGMRPKALFQALVSYDDRQLAKDAGFNWNGIDKTWTRKMAIEDAAKLPFKTVQWRTE